MKSKAKPDPRMHEVEQRTKSFAAAYDLLATELRILRADLQAAQERHRDKIKTCVTRLHQRRAELKETIDANHNLFVSPRTRTIEGVKVGLRKQKGEVKFDDEDKVVERIEKLLPKDQAELLIRVTKKVHKPGVYDLTAGDTKRLGISIEDDCDEPVIKPVDGDIDKQIDKLLDGLDDGSSE